MINLKVRTNQKSGDVQRALFSLGCVWCTGSNVVGEYTYHEYLFVRDNVITCGDRFMKSYFENQNLPELTVEEIYEMADYKPKRHLI